MPAKAASEFDRAFAAWRETWCRLPLALSPDSKDYAQSEEFEALVALGEQFVPLVMAELVKDGQFFALQAVKRLLPETDHPPIDHSPQALLGGEQYKCHQWLVHWRCRQNG